jgi:hypothetical protein
LNTASTATIIGDYSVTCQCGPRLSIAEPRACERARRGQSLPPAAVRSRSLHEVAEPPDPGNASPRHRVDGGIARPVPPAAPARRSRRFRLPRTSDATPPDARHLDSATFAADRRRARRRAVRVPDAPQRTALFTLAAVATLAIGIGATTAIFSVVDGVLLKPLRYSRPERVVALFQSDRAKHLDHEGVAPANFQDWANAPTRSRPSPPPSRSRSRTPDPTGRSSSVTGTSSENFFSVLGARPALGRLFVAPDFEPGAPPVLVLALDALRST